MTWRGTALLLVLVGACSALESPAPVVAAAATLSTLPTLPTLPMSPPATVVPPEPTPATPAATPPSTTPAATPPSTVGWSSAAAATPAEAPAPVGISIPSLEVEAPVIAVGVDNAGLMSVPESIDQVAWYQFGPSPGQPGSAVLAAHVDMAREGPGLFYDIDRLGRGSEVTVWFSDGSQQRFQVEANERYPKAELDLAAVFARDGRPTLTLITCGGGFNRTLRSYQDNVVVSLVPVRT